MDLIELDMSHGLVGRGHLPMVMVQPLRQSADLLKESWRLTEGGLNGVMSSEGMWLLQAESIRIILVLLGMGPGNRKEKMNAIAIFNFRI